MKKISKSIALIISFTFLMSLFSSQNLRATPALAIPAVLKTNWTLAFLASIYYGILGTVNALKVDDSTDSENDGNDYGMNEQHPVPARGTGTSPDNSTDPDFGERGGWTIGPDGETYDADSQGIEIF